MRTQPGRQQLGSRRGLDRGRPIAVATLLTVAAACHGPQTQIHNPQGHRVFVDGREVTRATLPFRYYGTSRWDAQPRDEGQPPPQPLPAAEPPPRTNELRDFDIHGWQTDSWRIADAELVPPPQQPRVALGASRPDWTMQTASQPIELPAPVSPWVFPLDLPLELLRWALVGQDDFTAEISLPATAEQDLPTPEIRPVELDQVAARARQARTLR